MLPEQKYLYGIFLVAIAGIFLIGYGTSTAATAGIQIIHNGKPINNLEVRVYLPGYSNPATPNKILTTDGTGFAILSVSHDDLWSGNSVLYGFAVNGTSYSFSEPLTQIVEVSV